MGIPTAQRSTAWLEQTSLRLLAAMHQLEAPEGRPATAIREAHAEVEVELVSRLIDEGRRIQTQPVHGLSQVGGVS